MSGVAEETEAGIETDIREGPTQVKTELPQLKLC
jgi:hypothetical protein